MDTSDLSRINTYSKNELYQKVVELQSRVQQLEEQLKEQTDQLSTLVLNEEKYKVLLDGSSDPIFSFSRDGEYQYVNYAFAEGVCRKIEEIIHHKIWDVFPQDEADKRFAVVKAVFETGEIQTIEVRVPRPDKDRYYLTTVKPIFDREGKVALVICISKEITERKQLEKELIRLSNFDTLTGLYNRHYFEVEMERLQVSQMFPVSIIISDMDKLKVINDQFGHAAGDIALQKMAMVLQDSIRTDDVAARIGGDEFAILLTLTNEETAAEIVRRIKTNIHALDDAKMHLSIGFATGEAGANLVDVFRLADERMYLNKRNGIRD
ncbi:diguanylate cyclase [Leptolinea tardivitalis]|uniref:sensor domain-containing diguanylate cyclase n=1 Tax=Leptolinea tardivitalis TaxID=229920 RepID=UPI00078442D2|nr:diguanylate cyclase [Leptolinea tardivitalis]GAP20252.1 protein containing PAS domain S-box [Leptolinea tardivitalis]